MINNIHYPLDCENAPIIASMVNNNNSNSNGKAFDDNFINIHLNSPFDHSDHIFNGSNDNVVKIHLNNNHQNDFCKPKMPTLLTIPDVVSTTVKEEETSKRRRSSARSIYDLEKKYVICQQASSNPPSSLASSIMQALSTTLNTAATTTTVVVGKPHYQSYPQRWFVLATVCLLALSNATQWMSFVSLHDAATAFYCNQDEFNFEIGLQKNQSTLPLDCGVEYWTSQIFQMIGVLTGIFGMYITDRYGIRISCFCGSVLNFVGAVIRVISSAPQLSPKYRLPLLYTGQTVAATSQPFFLCLSPKVAEYWFPETQRTFANALSFIANPFGVVVGSAVPVLFVDKKPTTSNSLQIFHLNLAVMILATIVVLMNFAIRSSHPPTPPSASSDCSHKPLFFQGLFLLFKKPIFYIQTITFGMAFAIQWSFFITADKLLTTLKYFDTLSFFYYLF